MVYTIRAHKLHEYIQAGSRDPGGPAGGMIQTLLLS